MLACSESPALVTFRGGFVASEAVVIRLLDLERRGARFVLESAERFRVVPASVLTPDDTAFLRQHLAEARAIVRYQADDAHLFDDTRHAQRPADGAGATK